MRRIIVLGIAVGLTLGGLAVRAADAPAPAAADPGAAARRKLDELAWLEGTWKGTGWSATRDGGRETFAVEERASRKAGGSALLLEGLGTTTANGSATPGHDAVGLILWDGAAGGYRFAGTDARGHAVVTMLEPADGAWRWSYDVPGGMKVRFTLRRTAEGRWHETGEIARGDSPWRQFMEMTLERVAAGSTAAQGAAPSGG